MSHTAIAVAENRESAVEGRSDLLLPRRLVALEQARTVAYAEAGAGRDIVLIHGTLSNLDDLWLGLVPSLARDFHVLAVDRPGHGESRRHRFGDASLERQASLIHEAVVVLGLDRPVLVGHSSGGAVALTYALRFPEATRGVVALAPICFPELRLEQMLFGPRAMPGAGPWLGQVAHATTDTLLLPVLWRAMFLPQAMPPSFAERFSFGRAGQAGQIRANGEDALALGLGLMWNAAHYASCRVPVRILGGEADLVVNNRMHGAAAAGLIPDASFRMLRGMGHMLHHFCQEEIGEAVRDVIR